MRKFLRLLSRPGAYIALVAFVVLVGAGALWRGMAPVADAPAPAASPDPVAAVLRTTQANGDVALILRDVAAAAYEERLDASLEDGVKQADFALVQAMLRRNIEPDEAVVKKSELRHDESGPYHYQCIRIAVGSKPKEFIAALDESLKAWTDWAELARSEDAPKGLGTWTVSISGVMTHELELVEKPSPHSPPVVEGASPGRILRRRAPGAAARLVVVMDDLGEDMRAARLLAELPYSVTFAVWPRSTHARRAAELGHASGREIIIHQPTEPIKYPEISPGPGALYVSLSDVAIEALVRDSLARVPHAVGINNHMGSRFTRDKRGTAAMIRALDGKGFFVLDSLTHPASVLYSTAQRAGLPAIKRDIFLDADPRKENVLRQLRKAENIALMTGRAVAIGHPLPGTLAALKEWDAHRNPHVELVRLSDLLSAP